MRPLPDSGSRTGAAFNAANDNLAHTVNIGDCVLHQGDAFADLGLLTLAEAARLLHCSKAHVCNAVAGRVRGCPPIPAVSLGRRKLVRRESLISWIERNEQAVSDAKIGSPVRGAGKRA